jgi:hypothetical protein
MTFIHVVYCFLSEILSEDHRSQSSCLGLLEFLGAYMLTDGFVLNPWHLSHQTSAYLVHYSSWASGVPSYLFFDRLLNVATAASTERLILLKDVTYTEFHWLSKRTDG